MEEYSRQAIFLVKNKINTDEQLLNFEKATYEKINPLKSERENLWRKLKKLKLMMLKNRLKIKLLLFLNKLLHLLKK